MLCSTHTFVALLYFGIYVSYDVSNTQSTLKNSLVKYFSYKLKDTLGLSVIGLNERTIMKTQRKIIIFYHNYLFFFESHLW